MRHALNISHNSINHPYDTKHPHTLSVPFKHVRLKDIPLSHLARLNDIPFSHLARLNDIPLSHLAISHSLRHPHAPSLMSDAGEVHIIELLRREDNLHIFIVSEP